MKLINAVFKELDVINDPIYRFDILKLKAIYYCLQVCFKTCLEFSHDEY